MPEIDPEFDPSGPRERELGNGLFEQEMAPSSAMAHLYRGEIHRMRGWRERLDRTTNWAVTVIAAILTWAFTSPDNPHYLVLIGMGAAIAFLGIEAHRYRGYDVWRSRVRMIQQNVWAHGLNPSTDVEDYDWRRELADDYREPTLKVSFEEALAHRLRRIYLPLLTIVLVAWLVRITAFAPGDGWFAGASVGMIPGWLVVPVVLAIYAVAVVIGCRPRRWHGHSELRTQQVGEWSK
ncbi:MAG: DUF2270 domain-containing protein [Halapricum sp.]